jgi:hypothetical protein
VSTSGVDYLITSDIITESAEVIPCDSLHGFLEVSRDYSVSEGPT